MANHSLFDIIPAKILHTTMHHVAKYLVRSRHSSSSQSITSVVLSVVCLTMALGFSTLVTAQEASNVDDIPKPTAGETEKVTLASSLQDYGLKNDDPLALITAVKLYKELSAPVLEKDQTDQGIDGEVVDFESLLSKAEAIAQDKSMEEVAKIANEMKMKKQQEIRARYSYYEECRWAYSYNVYVWICGYMYY